MNHIEKTIEELNDQIQLCTEAVRSLKLLAPGFGTTSTKSAAPVAPIAPTAKRKYTKRKITAAPEPLRRTITPPRTKGLKETPPLRDVGAALDKPQSIGGALKSFIRNQTRFTGESMRALLLADPDYARLIENGSAGVLQANLTYWVKQGYLSREGDSPLEATYTVVDRDWFNR